jgi:hypothetical protein
MAAEAWRLNSLHSPQPTLTKQKREHDEICKARTLLRTRLLSQQDLYMLVSFSMCAAMLLTRQPPDKHGDVQG